ncbi:MAG: hypothetical protein B7Z55_12745 [Planctomycetales bacterium 12-60-4]|nr:MAG: hypothetical protein B7Z55_12745 [Planctomycetales bacterium 12-60-4]
MFSFRTLITVGLLLCLASFGVGAAVVWYWRSSESSSVDSEAALRRARRELAARNWGEARAAAEQIAPADRHYYDALLILGEVAARQDRWDEALTYYARIPRDGTETDVRARLASADIEFNQGRLQRAHDDFRYGLSFFPDEPFALSRLSLLLDFSGRRHEASQLLFDLVRMRWSISPTDDMHSGATIELQRDNSSWLLDNKLRIWSKPGFDWVNSTCWKRTNLRFRRGCKAGRRMRTSIPAIG